MRKIAIANRKGGVGKTTTAVHIAAALTSVDQRVLLIDTDTQAQCSRMLGVDLDRGLAELVDKSATATEALIEARPGLWLLAGGSNLSGLSRDISRRDFKSEAVLSEALEIFDDRFDFVIIDSAPGYNPLSINVLVYADEVLCPVSMEAMAVDGLVKFLEETEPIREYSGLEIRYVLPTFLDGRVRKSAEILEQLAGFFGERLLQPVHYSVKLSEAPGWGKTVFEYAPRDRGSIDYGVIAGEVLKDGKTHA